MSKWNEIIGYDNEKDYNWQDESVKLPKLNEEVLISWQDKQRPNRSPFVGYFKQTEFGVQTIISANDGMDFCPLQNGMRWRRFNQPDMREKIKEYISELDTEIDRLESDLEKQMTHNVEACKVTATESRLNAIIEVKNDLLGRLEEVM